MSSSSMKTKALVNKATTDDRNPPTGYLLTELAKRTMSIQECQVIEDLITKKLTKNKPYIKYKALKIIRYICENGSPNWRRNWQRNTDKLRDCQQYRGPPDPIYGDAPYQQVRQAAKDAMQAVFQSNPLDASNLKSRIKSIDGNTSYSNTTFGSGSSGVFSVPKSKPPPVNRWDNNYNSNHNNTNNSISSFSSKPMPGMGNTKYIPQVRKQTFEPLKSAGPYNPALFTSGNAHSRGKLDNRGAGHKRKRGKAGGVWGDDDNDNEDDEEDDDEDDNDEFRSEDIHVSQYRSATFTGNRIGGRIRNRRNQVNDGTFEKKWVEDIVKGAGIGAKIVDVKKYVQQFENLSQNHVLEYLDDSLDQNQTWQKRAKALTLIDALLNGKSKNVVAEYYSQSYDNLKILLNANKSVLRKNAQKILTKLDIDPNNNNNDNEEEEEEEEYTISKESSSHKQIDLLAMDNNNNNNNNNGNKNNRNNLNNNNNANDNLFDYADQVQEDIDNDNDNMFDGLSKQPELATNIVNNTNNNQANNALDVFSDNVNVNNNNNNNDNQNKKSSNYDFLNDLAVNQNVHQQNLNNDANDILNWSSNNPPNNNRPTANTQIGSAFGLNLTANANPNANNNNNMNNMNNMNNNSNNTANQNSAFGFMNSSQTKNASTNQTQQNSSFGFMNQPQSTIMTQQLINQNTTNQQYMQNLMQNANAMNSMMAAMNMNPMQPMPTMQPMGNMGNMNMSGMSNMNMFGAPQANYSNVNDPFAAMINSVNQPKPPRPSQKPAKDPFAEFSIKTMQK